jgi:hypothetical protein
MLKSIQSDVNRVLLHTGAYNQTQIRESRLTIYTVKFDKPDLSVPLKISSLLGYPV